MDFKTDVVIPEMEGLEGGEKNIEEILREVMQKITQVLNEQIQFTGKVGMGAIKALALSIGVPIPEGDLANRATVQAFVESHLDDILKKFKLPKYPKAILIFILTTSFLVGSAVNAWGGDKKHTPSIASATSQSSVVTEQSGFSDLFTERIIYGKDGWRVTVENDVRTDEQYPDLSEDAGYAIDDLELGSGTLNDVIETMIEHEDFKNPSAGLYNLVSRLNNIGWFETDLGPKNAQEKFKIFFSTLIANDIPIYEERLTSTLIRACGSLGICPEVDHPITKVFIKAYKETMKEEQDRLKKRIENAEKRIENAEKRIENAEKRTLERDREILKQIQKM